MIEQNALQIRGVNVEAARYDDIFLSVTQYEETGLIDQTDVPGPVELLALRISPVESFGGLGVAEIARHHGWRAPHDLPHLAGRQFGAGFVDDPDIVARCRATHGVIAVGMGAHIKD